MTAPKKIFPPNTCAADTATSTGKNAKDVLEAMSKNAYQSVDAKEGIALPNASTRPIIKPAATIAGRIGTNTSPRVLISCFHHGIWEAAAALTSSLLPPVTPLMAINSS